MFKDSNLNAVCSVSEMAVKVGLSRARFYQLVKAGVFPIPVYCIRTRRPFYSLDLQNKCIEIRRTGVSPSGQPVLFNRIRKDSKSPPQADGRHKELALTLRRMGLEVTAIKVKDAVAALFPESLLKSPDDSLVVRELFRYFSKDCRNGV